MTAFQRVQRGSFYIPVNPHVMKTGQYGGLQTEQLSFDPHW